MKGVPLPEGRIKNAVFARDGWRCRYCGVMTSYRRKNMPYSRTVDHVIPRSKGGRSNIINLVTACKSCNDTKKSLTLAELGWTMRPRPVWSQGQFAAWKSRTSHYACVHCAKQPKVHAQAPYHGGPRKCPTGDTDYMAMAHYIVLQRLGRVA